MSTLALESVISDEIINEFSQKASGTVIWSDCSNWFNEQRTFTALRNYAPSWFSMLIMHTSSEELLELASDDPRQDTRYAVAINPNTPRYLLEMLASGASQWVKEAAFANPNIVSSELEHGGREQAA
jgi:Ni,Fe-hydrogenase III component G